MKEISIFRYQTVKEGTDEAHAGDIDKRDQGIKSRQHQTEPAQGVKSAVEFVAFRRGIADEDRRRAGTRRFHHMQLTHGAFFGQAWMKRAEVFHLMQIDPLQPPKTVQGL